MAHASRWLLPQLDREAVGALAKALGIGSQAAGVLFARGFQEASAARRFLCPSLDDLHDPLNMRGMDCALERETRPVRHHEKLPIYGDYDVDCASSGSIPERGVDMP